MLLYLLLFSAELHWHVALCASIFFETASITSSFHHHVSSFLLLLLSFPHTTSHALNIPSLNCPHKFDAPTSTNFDTFSSNRFLICTSQGKLIFLLSGHVLLAISIFSSYPYLLSLRHVETPQWCSFVINTKSISVSFSPIMNVTFLFSPLLNHVFDTHKPFSSFKMAKRQLNRGRLQFTSVLEEDGTLTTDRERIVERSREFYEKLYSSTRQEPPEADIEQQFEGFPNIKAWEVKSAVKQSKKGKAPGPDNITIDLIDAAGDIINDKLATLFNECLIQSKVPEIWNEAIIILLHKKGDQKNISNYRPISLLNNIYKLFTKIITNRITRTLDENQPREQAGFRRGFSTIDHLHAVNQLIEKCAEYKMPLVVGLVDYNKAFDLVEIPDVIEALQEQGVDPVYVNVLKHIYKQAKSFIRLHKDSKPFQVSRGVRQGDTSSPKLFTACLEKVFRKLNWSRRGILIDGEYLSHLRFADDIIIFTRNIAELHEMLQELNQASLEVGLSMNFKKTKIMRNKHAEDTNRKITIDSNEIEEVDHYIYLGQRISMETASKEQEIKRRITLGWQAFGRASAIFKNKEIPTCLKRQVYNECIIPTVTYGSETWNLTKIQTMKLRSMQRAHERIMLNITWRDHKTAEWIREQTKLRDILETISKAKWTWAGHLTRRTDNRWTTKLTFWQPRGHTRNKGRPKFRWRDDLDKFRKHWHRDASDRLRWRQMGKAYVQLRTFKG